jgi:hypothetical protein
MLKLSLALIGASLCTAQVCTRGAHGCCAGETECQSNGCPVGGSSGNNDCWTGNGQCCGGACCPPHRLSGQCGDCPPAPLPPPPIYEMNCTVSHETSTSGDANYSLTSNTQDLNHRTPPHSTGSSVFTSCFSVHPQGRPRVHALLLLVLVWRRTIYHEPLQGLRQRWLVLRFLRQGHWLQEVFGLLVRLHVRMRRRPHAGRYLQLQLVSDAVSVFDPLRTSRVELHPTFVPRNATVFADAAADVGCHCKCN